MKINYCGWCKGRMKRDRVEIVGKAESLTGKWADCCKKCWNKLYEIRNNPKRTDILSLVASKLGMKLY